MGQSCLRKTRKMHQKASRLSFKSMLPFVVIDPRAGDPDNTRGIGCIFVLCLDRFDDSGHGSLFAKPTEIVFRVRQWISRDLSEKVNRRRVNLEVEDAIVEAVVICCHQSVDIVQMLRWKENTWR